MMKLSSLPKPKRQITLVIERSNIIFIKSAEFTDYANPKRVVSAPKSGNTLYALIFPAAVLFTFELL